MEEEIIEWETCPNCKGTGQARFSQVGIFCDICDRTGRVIKKKIIITKDYPIT